MGNYTIGRIMCHFKKGKTLLLPLPCFSVLRAHSRKESALKGKYSLFLKKVAIFSDSVESPAYVFVPLKVFRADYMMQTS